MSKKLLLLTSFLLALALAANTFAEDRWTNMDRYEEWMDWFDADKDGTWFGDIPTNAEVAHVDGWCVWVEINQPGATAGELHVGCWYTPDPNGRMLLNIYPLAGLVVDAGNLDEDTGLISTGNFMLGVQPYMDWGNPDWGNHGWGVVTMTGGTVIAEGNLAVGVNGLAEFYLNGGIIRAETFSMGTPRNATEEEDPDRVVDYDFGGRDNMMDITGGKLLLAGNITALDPRVAPYNTRGYLNFAYEADEAGYTTITATEDVNIAWAPAPTDGRAYVPVDSNLYWSPGDNAQDVNGQEVYLGTDFTEVNDADITDTTGIFREARDANNYDPGILDWATTYYWRVDQVNETNTRWEGKIWRFSTIAPTAKDPSPGNGQEQVPLLTNLTWTPGDQAVSHEVYFSTDFNDVNDANQSVMTVEPDPCHDPGVLDFSTSYYWRVDEVNLAADVNRWPGEVWRFMTADHLVVDDFDSYPGTAELKTVWLDGYQIDNYSTVGLEVEPTLVRSGKSMRLDYYNLEKIHNLYGSEVAASASDLMAGTDWTMRGVKSLVLWFYGQTDNTIGENDRMFVALKDGSENEVVAPYNEDANHVAEEQWHEWNIDLTATAFSSLNLNDISTVYIGFGVHGGDPDAEGGLGEVYFDDIRLYPRRCRPQLVLADLNDDCTTDIWDLYTLANYWLEAGNYTVYAQPAPTTPAGGLLAWYKFDETMGSIAADSSGNGYDAPVNVDYAWDSTGGFDGNSCLYTATGGIIVDVPDGALYDRLPMSEITISLWLKPEYLTHTDWTCPFGGGTDGDFWLITAMNLNYISTEPGYYVSFYGPSHSGWMEGFEFLDPDTSGSEGWHHYAFWKDANQSLMRIYRDGVLLDEADWGETPIRPLNPDNREFYIGTIPSPSGWGDWQGWIDDVRIYDHALPHPQIVDLAAKDSAYQPYLPGSTGLDIKPDSVINLGDYTIMAGAWLEEELWP